MPSIRITKEIQTSLHNIETNLVEFKYSYSRDDNDMRVKIAAYKVIPGDSEILELIPAGGSDRKLGQVELTQLIIEAVKVTPISDNPLEYMDALVETGIKLMIISEGLWKDQLVFTDFIP